MSINNSNGSRIEVNGHPHIIPNQPEQRQIQVIEEDYSLLLEEMYSSGEWFQVPKNFMLIMSCEEVIFLSYLINISRMVKAQEGGGWFYHTNKQITGSIGIPQWKQNRVIRTLKEKNYLKVEQRGIPSRNFYKIMFINLRNDIIKAREDHCPDRTESSGLGRTEPFTQERTNSLQHIRSIETNKEKEDRGPSATRPPGLRPFNQNNISNILPYHRDLALRFKKFIEKRDGKIGWNKATLEKWARYCYELERKLQKDQDKIEQILRYLEQKHKEKRPKITSPGNLLKPKVLKWLLTNIEQAIKDGYLYRERGEYVREGKYSTYQEGEWTTNYGGE